MSKTILLLILTFSAVPVASQTVSEIEETYGKPTLAYSVSEHIWMTPDFAADGQVCRMRFYSKRFDRKAIKLGGHLVFSELKSVLNQIVPPLLRGSRGSSFGIGTFGGGIIETDYEYENVTFTFIDSLRITIDPKSLKKSDEFVLRDGFPVAALPKPPPPSESDFDGAPKAQIVILRWSDRTCGQDRDDRPPDFQSVAQIEQRFGQPQKIYPVGSHTSMSADFAADGQVCQLRLYPRRVSGNTSHLGNTLVFEELASFLNSFVPPEHRGLQQEVNFGTTATGGPAAWTTYPYENVYFSFISSFGPHIGVEPLLRRGEFTFSIPYSPQTEIKDRSPSKHDFVRTDDKEIATVRWLRRTCVQ